MINRRSEDLVECCESTEFSVGNYCTENRILHNLTLELNTTCMIFKVVVNAHYLSTVAFVQVFPT